ncbi:MAG: ATP-grasp fold amidoligase family protein [Gammaproteobacteria bacterium]|nr:ATP-grasp fold amidoligase family protein [Gammaproteobacteria bacterium]
MALITACFNTLLCVRHRRLTRIFRKRLGRLPNYAAPQGYNDKIQWRKLFDRNPLFPVFLDKIAVRGHVARITPGLKMPDLLWTGTNPEAIPFDRLPGRYVIKPNCRSGCNHFVLSPSDADPPAISKMCRKWLAGPFGQAEKEWGYLPVERRLMVEAFLDSHPEENRTRDFRFHVFNGRVHLITAADCKITGTRRVQLGMATYYDREWRQLPYFNTRLQSGVPSAMPRPHRLDTMISAAETLASGIDHLRVDLYLVEDHVYFGELTVYPTSGLVAYAVMDVPGLAPVEDFDTALGRPWQLPEISTARRLYRGLFG